MSIRDHYSHLTTADRFLTHWEDVETAIGGALVLANGVTRGDLAAVRQAAAAVMTEIVGFENALESARWQYEKMRAELIDVIGDFRIEVRYRFRESSYSTVMPTVPARLVGYSRLVKTLDQIAHLWEVIELNSPPYPGFTPPLLVKDLTRAGLLSKIDSLHAAHRQEGEARLTLSLARTERDTKLRELREITVSFRLAILASFEPEHALVLSCPVTWAAKKPVRKKEQRADSKTQGPG